MLPFVRVVGDLPPEPAPDKAKIPRDGLPPIVKELASKNSSFVVFITLDSEGIYRGRSFTWDARADDDVWMTSWFHHDFGTYTKDIEVIMDEARRQIEAYEKEDRVKGIGS
jgi:hypothetical protein